MNISASTPISGSKKRDLSSPEDLLISKKNRVSIGSLDISEETDFDISQDMASTNIALDEAAIQSIAEALKDTIVTRLTDTISGLAETIVKGVIDGLSTRIDKLEAENKALTEKVHALELSADTSEQYSRRNCLRISGVKEVADEDTDSIAIAICKDVGSPISINDIDRSHRIGKPSDRPRAILVKFATYRARQQLYKKRTALRNCGRRDVFVNEDLTRPRQELLYEARKLLKAKRIEGAWSSDGTVLIRAAGAVHRIQYIADLLKFTGPAVSGRAIH